MSDEVDTLRAAIVKAIREINDGHSASDIVKGLELGLDPLEGKMCVSLDEGSDWIAFEPGTGKDYNKVHAIRFENGQIWDCVNGWRQGT